MNNTEEAKIIALAKKRADDAWKLSGELAHIAGERGTSDDIALFNIALSDAQAASRTYHAIMPPIK